MFRKRRQPTPYFRLPPPYQPITGAHAELMVHGVYPYVAMMQVAAEDTHENYVLCRGFDIRCSRFVDYTPGIPVAKPFWNRRVRTYRIGHIFPAVLPLQTSNPSPTSVPWRIGQNPGVATTSTGQPADLSEEVELLYDDDGILIDWMMVDSDPGMVLVELCLAEDHPGQSIAFDAYRGVWDPSIDNWDYSGCTEAVKAIDHRYGVPYPDAGATGLFTPRQSDTYGVIYECVSLDCTSEGPCCTSSSSGTATSSATATSTATSTVTTTGTKTGSATSTGTSTSTSTPSRSATSTMTGTATSTGTP